MELTQEQIENLTFAAYLNWRTLIGVQEGEETLRYYQSIGRISEQNQTLLTLGVNHDVVHKISMDGLDRASAEYGKKLREQAEGLWLKGVDNG